MAQNFFIKFDRDSRIVGASVIDGYVGDIQVLSWSHSFTQPTTATRSSAGGGTIDQANHSDFSFTKYTDKASCALIKYCWTGKALGEATFVACRPGADDRPVPYLRVTMSNVIVSNVSIGGGTGDLPTETITLSYAKVAYTYTDHNVAGPPEPVATCTHDLVLQQVS